MVRIAGIYDGNPKQELSIRALAKQLKGTYSYVYAEIEKMAEEKTILVAVKGRAKMCSLNLESDKAKALLAMNSINEKEIFLKKHRIISQLLNEFVNRVGTENVYAIVLFGSYAKGSASEKSDIDLLVVGSSKAVLDNKINSEANSLQARYGKELNPLIIDKPMFIKSMKSKEVTAVKEALSHHVILFGFERYWELVKEALE